MHKMGNIGDAYSFYAWRDVGNKGGKEGCMKQTTSQTFKYIIFYTCEAKHTFLLLYLAQHFVAFTQSTNISHIPISKKLPGRIDAEAHSGG
ncbi:MAG: hypothetical protein ACOCP7_00880, partial [Desulfohalobiaceae bacterium]